MKKVLALILVLAMVLIMTACGKAPAANTETEKTGETPVENVESDNSGEVPADVETASGRTDKIIVSCSSDGTSLDLFSSGNWGNALVGNMMYQALAYLDGNKEMHLELAKSIEKVDDTHYAIELWDNIYDTAGNNITSADVEWCFQKTIDNGHAGAINRFDHFEIVDDYNLIWVCSAPFTIGEYEKNFTNVSIISKASYESTDFTTNPIGTGPYKLKTYEVGSTVVMEKNEDYWRLQNADAEIGIADKQNFQEIEFQIIQDASSRAMALETNAIDIADALNGTDVQYLTENADMAPVNMPQDAPISFSFNCSDASPCSSLELRQAICYAVDSASIVAGLDVPAVQAFGISPRMVDAPEEWTTGQSYYDYDVEKAKELVAASGYNGEELVMIYQSNTAYDGTAVMMQAQLKEVGINLKLEVMDQTTYSDSEHDFDAFDLKLEIRGGGSYLGQVLKAWTGEDQAKFFENGENNSMIADPELDALFVALREDNTPENIAAWDNHFTNVKCYGYAIATYYQQTAARSNVDVALGEKGKIWPNACSFK